jgi:glutaminase
MMHDIGQMTYDAHHTLLVYFRVCIAFAECHILFGVFLRNFYLFSGMLNILNGE